MVKSKCTRTLASLFGALFGCNCDSMHDFQFRERERDKEGTCMYIYFLEMKQTSSTMCVHYSEKPDQC